MRQRTSVEKLALGASALPLVGILVVLPSLSQADKHREKIRNMDDENVPKSWKRTISESQRRVEVFDVFHVVWILVMVFVFDVPLPW